MSDWKRLKAHMLDDPDFRAYYEARRVDMDISNALVRQRYEQGLSQDDLAKKSGVPVRKIKKYEELDKLPPLKTLKRLAAALECSLKIEFVPNEQQIS